MSATQQTATESIDLPHSSESDTLKEAYVDDDRFHRETDVEHEQTYQEAHEADSDSDVDSDNITPGAPATWFRPSEADDEAKFRRLKALHHDHHDIGKYYHSADEYVSNGDQARSIQQIANNRNKRTKKEHFAKIISDKILPESHKDEVVELITNDKIDINHGYLSDCATEEVIIGICSLLIKRYEPEMAEAISPSNPNDTGIYNLNDYIKITEENSEKIERFRDEWIEIAYDSDNSNSWNNRLTEKRMGNIENSLIEQIPYLDSE